MNYNGLAKIIPFVPRAQVRVGPPWTTAELGELFRVAHVLRQSGMMIETDMGLSDEGDPWFVFFSVQTEDVIAHFARIDGEIVVHGLSSGGVVSGVNLHDVVRRLQPVQAMEHQQKSQADRSVVVHPFMLLVAFIAASFLATEESQAAAPASKSTDAGEGAHASADTLAKTKSDWIDRAMALLHSKVKDRVDGAVSDLASSRKAAGGDTLQHSMALVMLAAAISQAQSDILSSDDAARLDFEQDAKQTPEVHKAVADDSASGAGSAGADALDAALVASTASDSHAVELRAHLDGAPLLTTGDASGLAIVTDANGIVPLIVPTPTAVGVNSVLADASAGAPVPLISVQDHIPLPEIIPVTAAVSAVSAGSITAPSKMVATLSPTATPTLITSIDITFEGGALQLHQNSVDLRFIEIIAGPQAPAHGAETGVKVEPVFFPVMKQITLTEAQENILVEAGDTRIKNFEFGVDQLVLSDPSLLLKQPEVQFSNAGDIIIKFSETTRVVLLGVFEPSQVIAGVASVDTV